MTSSNAASRDDQWLQEQATAFVFGELDPTEAAEFTALMESSAEVRASVATIRETAATLAAEFATTSITLPRPQREAVETAIEHAEQNPVPPITVTSDESSNHSFGYALAIAASLLLACGLTFPALHRVISAKTETQQLQKQIQEIERQNRLLAQRNLTFEKQIQSLQRQLAARPRAAAQDAQSDVTSIGDPSSVSPRVVNAGDSPDKTNRNVVRIDVTSSDKADIPGTSGVENDQGVAMNRPHDTRANETTSAINVAGGETQSIANQTVSDTDSRTVDQVAVDNPDNNFDATELAAETLATERLMDDAFYASRETANRSMVSNRRGLFESAAVTPLSAFPINVEREAYLSIRKLIARQTLPSTSDVAVEQMVNFFKYDYPTPQGEDAFAIEMDLASCPWNASHRLARIGIQGREVKQRRRPANLVFLIDVSGSMNRPEKLPLAVQGLMAIVEQLDKDDSIALVAYAGAKGLVLDATTGDQKRIIVDAIDRLRRGGDIKRGEGIQLAYKIAERHYIPGGTNRVILCTDDDCNVGIKDTGALSRFIQRQSDRVTFSAFQFGGAIADHELMSRLCSKGSGSHHAIKNRADGQEQFLKQIELRRIVIAQDIDLRIEFNPHEVKAYRLIGYEDQLTGRTIRSDTDLNDEVLSGHSVTALYEIVPRHDGNAGSVATSPTEGLRYQTPVAFNDLASSGEVMTLRLQYRDPQQDRAKVIEVSAEDSGAAFEDTADDFRFAAAVAAFGMLLQSPSHQLAARRVDEDAAEDPESDFDLIHRLASQASGDDPSGFRRDFVELVRQASKVAADRHG
ncbi:YfbK domain-containing protein [Roseiconus lacunae]|uniref:von Willebrand factor type A domain-containing protein n=1 Tax=Roseiconus lacunae TaxID=2605694 RepID=A0ABT7PG69_9BACT|nr:von Willebrand factor type A domain-containing protein [Roseiconus lacunae]MDM4015495.1 von Willebrand factor type A domain-containing protein [Roseiconus lacunae]